MLTKSAAKAFFLGGTALCSIAFVLLSLDTLAQFPERSNQDQMTEQVVRGHHIWNQNNCMGCHTLLGEGAYYAPELTKVVDRRSDVWIAEFLKDPERMFPGRRKMVKYDFYDADIVGAEEAKANIDDTLAFFHWVSKIDTNGFPAEPDMKPASASGSAVAADPLGKNIAEDSILASAPDYVKSMCLNCHVIDGTGNAVGPTLDGVADRFEPDYLRKWISDPQSVKEGTTMPNLGLKGEQLEDILNFLGTLTEK